MNNSRKTNLKLTENIAVQVPNTVSISEDILLQVSWKNDLLTYAWNYYVNSATWGPSTNCSKLLVSDTTNFFWPESAFLEGCFSFETIYPVFAWFWPDCLYTSCKYIGQVCLKKIKVLEQRYRLHLWETKIQLIFSNSFIPV